MTATSCAPCYGRMLEHLPERPDSAGDAHPSPIVVQEHATRYGGQRDTGRRRDGEGATLITPYYRCSPVNDEGWYGRLRFPFYDIWASSTKHAHGSDPGATEEETRATHRRLTIG